MSRVLFAPFSYVVLTLLAAACLVPFVWMLLTAFKPDNEVFSRALLPSRLAWENFPRAFTFFPFTRFLFNTMVVAVGGTGLHLVTSCLAAYAFARLRFRGREVLFLLYLGTLMVPQQVTIVPLFLMMQNVGWVDTFWALILPGAFHALGVFLLRQFFMTIPRELEESAFIDGASRLRILWQIILPLSKAGSGHSGRLHVHSRVELVLVAADRDHLARDAHAVGRFEPVHRPVRHRVAPVDGRGDGHAAANAADLCVRTALLRRRHRPDGLWRKMNR